MINLILGANGSGKTQKLIEMANNELKTTDGLIVYIDRSDNHRREIDVQIRFLNAKEVGIDNRDKFFGFISGVLNGNYDINRVYVDNVYRIVGAKCSGCVEALLNIIKPVANEVEIYMTMNAEDVEGICLDGINVINL
ncbi:MAG: hypothetical protein IKM61_00905 [Eubacteriaceae bacterium]|nr:hypothetical protein [Eubacteriaceae bacterium]